MPILSLNINIRLAVICLAIGSLGLSPISAYTFGGSPPKKTHSCPNGKAWNGKRCVKTSKLNDRQLIEQGRELAVIGHYASAIGVLSTVSDKSNPLALTYLGYSYRKSGHFDRGMAPYKQALSINPRSIVTREYLGEGYAEIGRIDLARLELTKVQRLCGNSTCEEYRDLAEAIKKGESQ